MVFRRFLSFNKYNIAARKIGAKAGRILQSDKRSQDWAYETGGKVVAGVVVNTAAVAIGWYLRPRGDEPVESPEQEFRRLHQNPADCVPITKTKLKDQSDPGKLMEWKPVGMHKHFRMLAIHDYMVGQGVVNPDDQHTRIPGIWAKLATLYDLTTLDEREDSVVNEATDDDGQGPEYYRTFDLPATDFDGLMDEKRYNPDGSESDSAGAATSRRESTIADTDEPRSSPVPGSSRASTRGIRTSTRKGRTSKLKDEVERKNSRRTSKATSLADDETGLEGDEDGDAGSVEAPDEESAAEDEDKGTGSKRSGRGGRRTRGSTKRGRRK